jgi:hypothetical protein
LEKKNINIPHYEQTKPKFTTISTVPQIKPSTTENAVNINYLPEQTTGNQNLVKNENLSDVDSDLDVFVKN